MWEAVCIHVTDIGYQETHIPGLTGKMVLLHVPLVIILNIACCFGVCRIKNWKFCLISGLAGRYLSTQGYHCLVPNG